MTKRNNEELYDNYLFMDGFRQFKVERYVSQDKNAVIPDFPVIIRMTYLNNLKLFLVKNVKQTRVNTLIECGNGIMKNLKNHIKLQTKLVLRKRGYG